MSHRTTKVLFALAIAITAFSAAAHADDTLKLAVGAPNNWDSGVPDIGKRAGIFKKHGLDLEILYTNGGGETLQAVISGSVDIGIGAGTGERARRLCQGRAGTHPARRRDRRERPLLVCAGGFAAEIVQGARRQDGRLFHQWRLDPHHAAGADQALRRLRQGRSRPAPRR